MNILPNELVLLGDDLERAGSLPRLDAQGMIAGRVLREADYDKIVVTHSELIADALREADVIADGSTLFYLGRILSIDALFAEVDRESSTFSRFVIAEDKLFRNPEARREVLGQILDYHKALRELDFAGLSDLLPDDHRPWLDANEDLIEQALREPDPLLLICGDRIKPRLCEYVAHLMPEVSVISPEVALLSLAIFSDGTHHILVPHVVRHVTAERGISIRVVVQDTEGKPVPASTAVEEEIQTKAPRKKMELDALLEEIRQSGGERAVQVATDLFDFAKKVGAAVKPAGASASVRIRDENTRRFSTLFVLTKQATFYIGWQERWAANADISPDVAKTYEQRLTEVLGRNPGTKTSSGIDATPLLDVGASLDQVQDAIRVAARALRHIED